MIKNFQLIRKQRKSESSDPPHLEVNGKTYEGELLEAWTDHFSSLAVSTPNAKFNATYDEQTKKDVESISDTCQLISSNSIPITRFEIDEAIRELKNKKAKDECRLVAENLKHAGPNLLSFLTSIINSIVQSRKIPDRLKTAILHPIHKKGKSIVVSGHYRGISITSIISKVLDSIQIKHQEVAINPKRSNEFSFTKGRSPIQATIILSELVSEAKDKKTTLIATSCDIEKAFDKISHPHQLRKLYLAGLPCSWWQLKQDSY